MSISRPVKALIGMGACIVLVLYQRRKAPQEQIAVTETPQEKKAVQSEPEKKNKRVIRTGEKKQDKADIFFGKRINSPFKMIMDKVVKTYGLKRTSLSHGYITKLTLPSTGQVEYLMGSSTPFNKQVASSLCKDKAATCEVLQAHGVPHIPCKLVSRKGMKNTDPRSGTWTVLLNMLKESQPHGLVLKPTKGAGGSSVYHCRHERELELAWRQLPETSFVVCPFRRIHTEIRVFVLYGKMEYAFRKTAPKIIGDGQSTIMELTLRRRAEVSKESIPLPPSTCQLLQEDGLRVLDQGEVVQLDWQHNLSHGASSHVLDLEDEVMSVSVKPLAENAATALRIDFCSVDVAVVTNPDTGVDEYSVLEVNSATGVSHHLRAHPESAGVMANMYSRAFSRLFGLQFKQLN